MKIIKNGTIKPEPPSWWIGIDYCCKSCDAVFQLEVSDKVDIVEYNVRCPNGVSSITVNCPTCEKMLIFQNNPIPPSPPNRSLFK